MFDLILLFINFTLFILSFIFIILDLKSYKQEKNEDFKPTLLPKQSKRALLFGLLALIIAIFISIGYV